MRQPGSCRPLGLINIQTLSSSFTSHIAHAMQQDEAVSEVKLKAEAVKLAQEMGLSGFIGGSGWLRGFTKRMEAKALKEQEAAPAVPREFPQKRPLSDVPAKVSICTKRLYFAVPTLEHHAGSV